MVFFSKQIRSLIPYLVDFDEFIASLKVEGTPKIVDFAISGLITFLLYLMIWYPLSDEEFSLFGILPTSMEAVAHYVFALTAVIMFSRSLIPALAKHWSPVQFLEPYLSYSHQNCNEEDGFTYAFRTFVKYFEEKNDKEDETAKKEEDEEISLTTLRKQFFTYDVKFFLTACKLLLTTICKWLLRFVRVLPLSAHVILVITLTYLLLLGNYRTGSSNISFSFCYCIPWRLRTEDFVYLPAEFGLLMLLVRERWLLILGAFLIDFLDPVAVFATFLIDFLDPVAVFATFLIDFLDPVAGFATFLINFFPGFMIFGHILFRNILLVKSIITKDGISILIGIFLFFSIININILGTNICQRVFRSEGFRIFCSCKIYLHDKFREVNHPHFGHLYHPLFL